MDMLQRQRCCMFMLLLLAALGILTTGYYLGSRTRELAVYRKRVRGKLLINANNTQHTFLTARDVHDVETCLFFVGYPRSSHSILASMIDAHPNAIVAHEFNLFPQLRDHPHLLTNKTALYNELYQNSVKQATRGWRSLNHSFASKGYNLKLESPQSWQGRFRRLRMIGDKSGGITARMYRDTPLQFVNIYQQFRNLVQVPLKVIHMVRNPYDMIATRLLYRFSNQKKQKADYNSTRPLNNPGNVSQAMKALFSEAKAVAEMSRKLNMTVLEVHNADYVQNPRREMRRVCQFLGLLCSSSYLDMIAKVTFSTLSVTRHSIVWQKEAHNFIESRILKFPFFKRYSFSLY